MSEVRKRRYRAPKARRGQLKAQWGKLPGDSPEIIYAWGDGCHRGDGGLIHSMLTSPIYHFFDHRYGPSYLEQLEERGYDITTLKFSIEKKSSAE